jgi:hypothetical protein
VKELIKTANIIRFIMVLYWVFLRGAFVIGLGFHHTYMANVLLFHGIDIAPIP